MSARTLERWRWMGEGPRFLKVGKRVVYPLSEIEAFEAERLHASTRHPICPSSAEEGSVSVDPAAAV
jgi:hypothetical protein